MNNVALKQVFFVMATALILGGQRIVYADGISVDIGSGDLGVSVGGIDIEVDDVDEIYHDEDDYEAYNHPLRTGVSYSNADIHGRDLSQQNLRGADFSNADITRVNLTGADLTGANFSNATFINCDLRGSIVDGADFTNADFGGSIVSGVDFSRANMTNVDINDVDITRSASLSSNNIEVILTRGYQSSPRVNLDIRFAYDSAYIEAPSMRQIGDLAKALHSSKLRNKEVIIEGHTDSDGSSTYNYELSQRRAQSVISVLVNHYGIALSRLTPRGFGEDRPVYSNKTSFGKSVNRRVAVAINL